jgi:Zn-dependent protease
MFIEQATANPQYYFAVIITVVVSIVIHELAHGWAAIRLGDDTPIVLNRMTPNPFVHMGGWSLAMLALVGIAWGQMPVNPSRLRGRYGGALVAVAGPASNLLLAVLAIVVMVGWAKLLPGTIHSGGHLSENLQVLLQVFARMNLVLLLLNLLPIPPLDGSRVLADFVPAYNRLINSPAAAGAMFAALLFMFFVAGRFLFPAADWMLGAVFRVLI